MQSRGADYGEDEYVSVIPSSDIEAQVRVTCPDKTGLGSDITRTIFDFGFVARVALYVLAPKHNESLAQRRDTGVTTSKCLRGRDVVFD